MKNEYIENCRKIANRPKLKTMPNGDEFYVIATPKDGREYHKYTFNPRVPFQEIEDLLMLALHGAMIFFGHDKIAHDAFYCSEAGSRACVIDLSNRIGRFLAKAFECILSRKLAHIEIDMAESVIEFGDEPDKHRSPILVPKSRFDEMYPQLFVKDPNSIVLSISEEKKMFKVKWIGDNSIPIYSNMPVHDAYIWTEKSYRNWSDFYVKYWFTPREILKKTPSTKDYYRFKFHPNIPFDLAIAILNITVSAVEDQHNLLDRNAFFSINEDKRTCIIDGETYVGRLIALIFQEILFYKTGYFNLCTDTERAVTTTRWGEAPPLPF